MSTKNGVEISTVNGVYCGAEVIDVAMEHKYQMLKEIEDGLADVLTANMMEAVMGIIASKLDRYDVASIGESEDFGVDMLDAFLDAKTIEGRSPKTVERYRYIITQMLKEIKSPIRQISIFHLRSYLMKERTRGVSDRSLEGMRSVFCSFFNWLQRENLISINPCANLGPIKCQKQVKIPYSDVDVEKLKDACNSIRDKALICFLLSTGCRISEVVGLNREDLDLRALKCKVLGKGNKERVVYFDSVTALHLKQYMETRNDDLPALFVGKGTERMQPGGVRFMLNNVAEKAGVEHVHPHRFRRTLATTLIGHGMPIQEVARILGHDKLDTTMKYVYLNDSDVQNSYRKYA